MIANIELTIGDITQINVDGIVNAANSGLRGGGGVDGAIHRAGGTTIMQELDGIRAQRGGCPPGQAVITTAGNLPAKQVIHTVGPIWQGGDRKEDQVLAHAYQNSLQLAQKHRLESVSFPNISTGVYGFPKEKAASIAIESVQKFLGENDLPNRVIFVCFDRENYDIYQKQLEQ